MFFTNRMAQRCALFVPLRRTTNCGLAASQAFFFSGDAANKPDSAEAAANKAEWGIKYDDECLKFEKEWQLIAERVQRENMVYIEAELSDLQKKKVEMLADKVLDMNLFEHRYFHALLAQRI